MMEISDMMTGNRGVYRVCQGQTVSPSFFGFLLRQSLTVRLLITCKRGVVAVLCWHQVF